MHTTDYKFLHIFIDVNACLCNVHYYPMDEFGVFACVVLYLLISALGPHIKCALFLVNIFLNIQSTIISDLHKAKYVWLVQMSDCQLCYSSHLVLVHSTRYLRAMKRYTYVLVMSVCKSNFPTRTLTNRIPYI